MDTEKLKKWGKRGIVIGLALLPFDAALIIAFIIVAGDPIGAFSLTMSLLALSAVLVGFGAAALSSGKDEEVREQEE
jgi:hypothetical protein